MPTRTQEHLTTTWTIAAAATGRAPTTTIGITDGVAAAATDAVLDALAGALVRDADLGRLGRPCAFRHVEHHTQPPPVGMMS